MSWKPRIEGSTKPKYLALVEVLEADIAAGRLGEGERLPPQRDLASDLGVTIATITRAIGEATRRGLVSARTGSGTFVRSGPAPSPTVSDQPIDLNLNTVPSGPAKPHLDDILVEIASERRSEDHFAYQPVLGSDRHRRALASWYEPRIRGGTGDPFLTHGAQHGLAACFAALVTPGDTVLCEAWTYTGIRRLAATARARLVGVAMDGEGLLPDRLDALLRETGARVVMASTAVQNPTTATMSLARRREVLAICRRHGALVVEDDIYGLLSGDPDPSLAALDPERVVYLGSVSKGTMPGLRLGLLSAPPHLAGDLQDKLVSLHWTAPSFCGEIVTRMIESGRAEACLKAHRREMEQRLRLAASLLDRCPVPALPSYHLWLPAPTGWRLDDVVGDLLARGVRVSPSSAFRVDERLPDGGHIRLSLGATDNITALSTGLRAVAAAWSGTPRLAGAVV